MKTPKKEKTSTEQESFEIDPEYECDAPKYFDFSKLGKSPLHSADIWFDDKADTPFSQRAFEQDPLLNSDAEDEEEEEFSEDLEKTPVPRNISISSSSCKSPIFGENDATPRPKSAFHTPSSSPSAPSSNSSSKSPSKVPIRKSVSHKFTPAKPSSLHKSLTRDELESSPPSAVPTPNRSERVTEKISELKITEKPDFTVESVDSSNEARQIEVKHSMEPATVVNKKVKPLAVGAQRSIKPLTVPVEFNFTQRKPTAKVISKSLSLKTVPESKQMKPHVTVPRPFNFHSAPKKPAVVADDKSPYVPLAVKVKQFDKTPDRFKPTLTKPVIPQVTKTAQSITVPKSPKLSTKTRIKKEPLLTSEERALMEIHSRQPFKARPVDARILNSHGDFGVPRIKKNPPTVAHSPNITKQVAKPTEEPNPVVTMFKANPVKTLKPFQPKIDHRVIKPVDFKLPGDSISEKKKQHMAEMLRQRQEQEKKVAEFKANPIIIDTAPLPHVPHPEPTLPHSPALQTKARGQKHRSAFEDKKYQEQLKLQQLAEFKAHPVPDLDKVFIPKRVDKPTTENDPVLLNTSVRAEERKHFDDHIKQREMELEKLKVQQLKEKEEQERLERLRLRKEAEFKAQGILKPVAFEAKKSSKPLTEPVSPFIGEKRKLLQKSQR